MSSQLCSPGMLMLTPFGSPGECLTTLRISSLDAHLSKFAKFAIVCNACATDACCKLKLEVLLCECLPMDLPLTSLMYLLCEGGC